MNSPSAFLKHITTTKNFSLRASTSIITPNIPPTYSPLNARIIAKAASLQNRLTITMIASKKSVHPKAVVRNRAVRRIRQAAYEALRENGYKNDGSILDTFGGGGDGNMRKGLKGTLGFWATAETVGVEWEVLRKEVGRAVEMFLRKYEGGDEGNRGGNTRRSLYDGVGRAQQQQGRGDTRRDYNDNDASHAQGRWKRPAGNGHYGQSNGRGQNFRSEGGDRARTGGSSWNRDR